MEQSEMCKHAGDSQQAIKICLSCEREDCPKGECDRIKPVAPNHKQWAREQEFLELYRQGLSDPKIAEIMGLAVSTVQYHRTRRALPANKFVQEKGRGRFVNCHDQSECSGMGGPGG